MELTHMEALAVMAGLNRLADALTDDHSNVADSMRAAVETARVKLVEHRNLDVEWRR